MFARNKMNADRRKHVKLSEPIKNTEEEEKNVSAQTCRLRESPLYARDINPFMYSALLFLKLLEKNNHLQ